MNRVMSGALRRLGRRGVLIASGCAVGLAVAAGVALATVPDGTGIVHLSATRSTPRARSRTATCA